MIEGITSNYEVDFKDILNLDSSNIQPEEWQFIAEQISQMHEGYDGIVVTHGTDTMAYTASVMLFYAAQYPDSGGINRFPTANPAPADRWGRKSALCFCHGSQRCAGGICGFQSKGNIGHQSGESANHRI